MSKIIKIVFIVLKCKGYHMPYYACTCREDWLHTIGWSTRIYGQLNWSQVSPRQILLIELCFFFSSLSLHFWHFLLPLMNPGLIIPHTVMYSRSLCSSLLDMCTYLKSALWLAAHQSATVTGLLLCNNKDHSQIPQILIGSQQDLQGVPECRGSVLCAVQQVKTLH